MDDHDALWKRIYDNMDKPADKEKGTQDLDGGFFQMFGSLTKEVDEKKEESDEEVETTGKVEDDAPIEQEEQDQMIKEFLGLNIEELYSEVLYEMLHMVGLEAETCDRKEIFNYLREAFKLEEEKHEELIKAAKAKEAPNIILNVEIIEAKDLKPKDPNGLSDPFCTLYLSSASTHKYHTCVKPETLNPTWEEHFYLPVENTSKDALCLEVWDFDPAETIKEKVTKISGVKGVKGLSKLMKEIAVTASTGKHDNEMIGVAQIKLKSIPSYGQTRWIELEKRPKTTGQGNLKLKLNFSSQKNHHVACQEYRHILRLLLLYELELHKNEDEEWKGKLSAAGSTVLGQHSSQSGLSIYHENMAQWIEFTKLHSNHHLSLMIFANLLESISPSIKEGKYSEDEVKMFWDGSKKLLPSIFTHIKNLKKINPKDRRNMEQTISALRILNSLCILKPNRDFELFPEDLYGWLSDIGENEKTITNIIKEAIIQSTVEWFQQSLDSSQANDLIDESFLKQAIKVTQTARNDLQRAVEVYDKLFLQYTGINYSKLVYTEYEGKVCDLVEPLVSRICASMKPISFKESSDDTQDASENDSVAMGTSLFELYLLVQRLSLLGSGIFIEEGEELRINKFHNWFYHGVAKWLDIAVYKAIGRIDKAIELDQLIPVDATVKYSSSALDTLAIFHQIKIFWTQLSWPDIEGSYTFVAKILDDLCRCSVYYADNTAKKLNRDYSNTSNSENSSYFSVTNEWCLAVNNIDYVKQSLQPFAKELGVEGVIRKLSDFKNQSTAETCSHTIRLVIENTVDIIGNKIIDLLETISEKMAYPVKQMLQQGCDNCSDPEKDIDRLMQYLDNNLMILHNQLNEMNFSKILSIIWQRVIQLLKELINEGLEKRNPVFFYKNLENYVDILKTFFQDGDKSLNTEEMVGMKKLLSVHGLETEDLIHEYYLERVDHQQSLTKVINGMLTVKLAFIGDHLKIDIMNARNLPPHDSNGFCDPFVKIVLLPKEKFEHTGHRRTKTHKKTLFPLFEETFTLELKTEERLIKNALVHFMVKDQDFIYFKQFVGEAFVPLSEVQSVDNHTDSVDQTHLKLTKPPAESKILKILDLRQGERIAKDFIKKQKNRMEGKSKVKTEEKS